MVDNRCEHAVSQSGAELTTNRTEDLVETKTEHARGFRVVDLRDDSMSGQELVETVTIVSFVTDDSRRPPLARRNLVSSRIFMALAM
jgi:hypothetical protein